MPRALHDRFTKGEIERALQEYASPNTGKRRIKATSVALGCSRNALSAYIKKFIDGDDETPERVLNIEEKFSREEIVDVLERNAGLLNRSAAEMGVSVMSVRRWLNSNDPEYDIPGNFVREGVDYAEGWLMKWLKSGDPRAVYFMLVRKGGYTIKEANDGKPPTDPKWTGTDTASLPSASSASEWAPPGMDEAAPEPPANPPTDPSKLN